MTMKTLLVLAVLLLLLNRSDALQEQPHIVFIVADDLGWADVGYRNEHVITPNIDQLAGDGVTLTNSYVTPGGISTRASLLTGYYSHRLGLQDNVFQPYQPKGMPLNATTIATELKKLNYLTYMIGKWNLGYCHYKYTPQGRGFDKFYGSYTGRLDYYSHGRNGYIDLVENDIPDYSADGVYEAEAFANKAVEYIETYHECPEKRPMFMHLSFQSVQPPLEPPQEYLDLYPYVQNDARRKKLAMITAMDAAIGQVVSALKSNGFWDDTVLIFSSANGGQQVINKEGNNWPLRGGKSLCWEGGTRAVSFVTSQRLANTGYNNTQMIHAVDWFPTILGLAGGTVDPALDLDGYDVWDAIANNAASPRTEFVYLINDGIDQWGLRKGDYKVMHGYLGSPKYWYRTPPETNTTSTITYQQGVSENVFLFNIADDPTEQVDLADQDTATLNDLLSTLDGYRAKVMPVFNPPDSEAADPANYCDHYSYGWCEAI